MKILSYRRFALWWKLAMDWFQRQFAAIAASIDFTPVEEKLDEVKGDVADVKTAVENIDFSEIAKQGTNPNASLSDVQAKIGTPATGQPTDLFAAIAASSTQGNADSAVSLFADKFRAAGLSVPANATLYQLYQVVNQYTALLLGDNKFSVNTPNTFFKALLLRNSLEEIVDEAFTGELPFTGGRGAFADSLNLKKVVLPNASNTGQSAFGSCSNVKYIDLRNCNKFANYVFSRCYTLEYLNLSKVSNINLNDLFRECKNLVDLVIGSEFKSSVSFSDKTRYDPSNAYDTNSSSLCYDSDLQTYGRNFSTNWDKWKWCIINHFAANLPDRTGLTAYTITFGSTVLSKFDTEMTQAFTSKNWTLA